MVDALQLLRRARAQSGNSSKASTSSTSKRPPAAADESRNAESVAALAANASRSAASVAADAAAAEDPSAAAQNSSLRADAAVATSTSAADEHQAPLRADAAAPLWTRTWPLDDAGDDALRIDEDPRGALAGGNGATVWDSALALLRAVEDDGLAPPGGWAGAKVLELGAGCGLVALALAARGADVVATERAVALPLLKRNAARNEETIKKRGGAVTIEELDWTAPSAVATRRYDVVAGSDLVFATNADCLEPLADLVEGLVKRGAAGVLAHELRDRDATPTRFLDALKRRGVRVDETARGRRGNHVRRVAADPCRVAAAATTWIFRGDVVAVRGHDVNIPWERVAAPATTWIFRGNGSRHRPRRGYSVVTGRGAAAATAARTIRRRRDPDAPPTTPP